MTMHNTENAMNRNHTLEAGLATAQIPQAAHGTTDSLHCLLDDMVAMAERMEKVRADQLHDLQSADSLESTYNSLRQRMDELVSCMTVWMAETDDLCAGTAIPQEADNMDFAPMH